MTNLLRTPLLHYTPVSSQCHSPALSLLCGLCSLREAVKADLHQPHCHWHTACPVLAQPVLSSSHPSTREHLAFLTVTRHSSAAVLGKKSQAANLTHRTAPRQRPRQSKCPAAMDSHLFIHSRENLLPIPQYQCFVLSFFFSETRSHYVTLAIWSSLCRSS